jgi:hypothetical protein
MTRISSVNEIKSFVLGTPTPMTALSVQGTASSSGWTHPHLARIRYFAPPTDGIQEYDFVATPPKGIALTVMTPISATFFLTEDIANYWGPGQPLKGVRVHAASNSLEYLFDQKPEKMMVLQSLTGDDSPYPLSAIAASFGLDSLHTQDIDWPFDPQLEKSLVGRLVRCYFTGEPLTMDYRRDRINIEVNPATQRVISVWPG